MGELVRADQVENIDTRDDDELRREKARKRTEEIYAKREAIRRAGGEVASSPDLHARLESSLRKRDKKVGRGLT